jgi:hypothetical protein
VKEKGHLGLECTARGAAEEGVLWDGGDQTALPLCSATGRRHGEGRRTGLPLLLPRSLQPSLTTSPRDHQGSSVLCSPPFA